MERRIGSTFQLASRHSWRNKRSTRIRSVVSFDGISALRRDARAMRCFPWVATWTILKTPGHPIEKGTLGGWEFYEWQGFAVVVFFFICKYFKFILCHKYIPISFSNLLSSIRIPIPLLFMPALGIAVCGPIYESMSVSSFFCSCLLCLQYLVELRLHKTFLHAENHGKHVRGNPSTCLIAGFEPRNKTSACQRLAAKYPTCKAAR